MKRKEEDDDEDVLEMPDEIPYAKVIKLAVEEVQPKGQKFCIRISKKCDGIPDQKDSSCIVRSFSDLSWLAQKIMKEAPQLIIVPLIHEKSYWNSIKDFTESFKHSHRKQLKKEEDRKFACKIVERFLNILGKISIQFIYKFGNSHSSLFTFLDEKYEMYKMQVYQKDQETTIDTIKARFGSGTKMVFGYFSGFMGTKPQKLATQKSAIAQMTKKIATFIAAQQKYLENIANISQNFLNCQVQIEKKQSHLFTLCLKSHNINQTLLHIQEQIDFIANLAEKVSVLEQKQINTQIEIYSKFINQQLEAIQRQTKRMMNQFISVSMNEHVTVNMSDFYTSK